MELSTESEASLTSLASVTQTTSGPDWHAVVHRHDGRLRSRVRRVLCRLGLRAHPELVEEVVQEVYCRLIESGQRHLRLDPGEGSGSDPALLYYLGIVAERTVLDQVRLASARKRKAVVTVRSSRRARRAAERVADPRPTPEQIAMHREQERHFLDRCRRLRGLGSGRRNAWVMRLAVLEGYTSREIARAAGGRLTAHNVDMLIHRLRRRLARDGFTVSRR